MTPLPANTALDSFYLDARARLLDLAAFLDRINRGDTTSPIDPRLDKIRKALDILKEPNGGRAERIQRVFSLEYDAKWEKPAPK